MSYYMKPAIGITVFIVFFSGALITGSVTDYTDLESTGVTQEDLQFQPDLPNPSPQEIDLKNDLVQSENIVIENSTQVNNTEYDSDYVVSLDNESQQGWVIYRIDGTTQYLTSQVTNFGFFESSTISLEEYVTADTDESPIDSTFMSREQTFNLADDANFLRIVIEPSNDRVYSLVEKDELELGVLDTIGAYVASATNTLVAWFSLLGSLPPVLWLVAAVISIVAVLIILEVVLW